MSGCGLCSEGVGWGVGLCERCFGALRRAPPMAFVPGLDVCRAWLRYDGPARQLVTNLKYRNDRRLLGWLADGVASLLIPPAGAVVTWIPTTGPRRRRRGFDQGALLARAVARRWGIEWDELLVRRPGPPQTGRSRAERQQGIAVGVAGRSQVTRPVVLVDDVVTSGASLRSGAAALRTEGAQWVGAATIARTPRSR